jgi:hypothetical protein
VPQGLLQGLRQLQPVQAKQLTSRHDRTIAAAPDVLGRSARAR